MDIKKGESLREKWGDKPCNHPNFEKETMGGVISGLGYHEVKTGDYICTTCGEIFTKAKKDRIKANRASE